MKRVVLSSDGVNRYGYRVLTAGIKLDNFIKNPVMYFGHSTWGLPIGTWKDIAIKDNVLSAVPHFDEVTDMSKTVKAMYDAGTLQAASIGFNVISSSDEPAMALPGQRYETVLTCELLEASLVGIPANPDATTYELEYKFDHQLKQLSVSNQIFDNKKNDEMSLKKIALHLGLKEDASEDAVVAAIDTIKSTQSEAVLQLGIDKGIVDDTNRKVYEAAIANDLEATKAYFLSFKKEAVNDVPATATVPQATLAQKIAAQKATTPATTTETADDRKNWSLLEWQQKDPQGLRQLRLNDVVAYDELVNKHLAD